MRPAYWGKDNNEQPSTSKRLAKIDGADSDLLSGIPECHGEGGLNWKIIVSTFRGSRLAYRRCAWNGESLKYYRSSLLRDRIVGRMDTRPAGNQIRLGGMGNERKITA